MTNLCVLQNLKKVHHDPWPHLIIENSLPEKIHNELFATLPNARLDRQKAVDKHGKLTWLLYELHNEKYPVSNIWKEFILYHTSIEFVHKVFNAFDKPYGEHMVITNRNKPEQKSNYYTEFSFVKHPPVNNVSSRTPHTDNEKEIYAGLLYLKEQNDKSTGGDFCIHRPGSLEMQGKLEYTSPGPIVKRCAYKSNNFVMFWNGRNTQHSVNPRQNATHPRWSINMIGRYTGQRNW